MDLFSSLDDRPAVPGWKPDTPPRIASRGIKEINLNFETNGLQWWKGDRPISATVRLPDGSIHFMPWGFAGGNLDEQAVKTWATHELRNVHIRNANTKFEVHMARVWGIDLEAQGCTVSDVQHYAALLDDHRKRFAIDILATEFLGGVKVLRLDESRMASYHASIAAPRAKYQVQLVHELNQVFWPQLTAQDLHRVRQLEDDVIYAVCEMEKDGAPIDEELLHNWNIESQSELSRLILKITEEVGFRFEPTKTGSMVRLYEKCGIPITEFTADGAPSFEDVHIKKVKHPTVQLARRARKISSLRSKFLVSYRSAIENGTLRFNLHQLRTDDGGTISGRFSSSDKNIQQVMAVEKQRMNFGFEEDDASHDDEIYLIRKLFRAPAGMHLFAADAKQIEYRLFAHYANSKKILDAYKQDPDLSYHKLVHSMLRPFKPDLVYKRAKDVNFALVYGAGEDKTAEMLDVPLEESQKITSIYHREFPEVKPLLKRAMRLANERGYVKTMLGRRTRFLGEPWKRERVHKALNGVIQGSAADINKIKTVEAHRARHHLGFKPLMTVHDELVGGMKDKRGAAQLAYLLNLQAIPTRVPILWDSQIAQNWGQVATHGDADFGTGHDLECMKQFQWRAA